MCIRDRCAFEIKAASLKLFRFSCLPVKAHGFVLEYPGPVSYTHLDVYKRQLPAVAGHQGAAGLHQLPRSAGRKESHPQVPGRSPAGEPVSYTHLDVYKRQVRVLRVLRIDLHFLKV